MVNSEAIEEASRTNVIAETVSTEAIQDVPQTEVIKEIINTEAKEASQTEVIEETVNTEAIKEVPKETNTIEEMATQAKSFNEIFQTKGIQVMPKIEANIEVELMEKGSLTGSEIEASEGEKFDSRFKVI
jgi:predicted transcriptional regulator